MSSISGDHEMNVSKALYMAEELRYTAENHGTLLFGRDLALVVLAQRVRELNILAGVQR